MGARKAVGGPRRASVLWSSERLRDLPTMSLILGPIARRAGSMESLVTTFERSYSMEATAFVYAWLPPEVFAQLSTPAAEASLRRLMAGLDLAKLHGARDDAQCWVAAETRRRTSPPHE